MQKGHPYERGGRRVDVMRKSSVTTSPTTERPLSFAQLELTDDDAFLNIPTSPELGDIKLEIFEVRVQGRGNGTFNSIPSVTEKIHERTKKAVGHRFKLGEEIRCREKQFVTIQKLGHIVTFIFRYRPLAILQANGIVPSNNIQTADQGRKRAAPTPAAAPARNVLDLTMDDDDNEPRNRPMKRVKTEVKAEVKSESDQPWPRSLGMKQLGDVIDLT